MISTHTIVGPGFSLANLTTGLCAVAAGLRFAGVFFFGVGLLARLAGLFLGDLRFLAGDFLAGDFLAGLGFFGLGLFLRLAGVFFFLAGDFFLAACKREE